MVWNIRRPNSPVNVSIKEEFNLLLFVMVVLTIIAQVLLVLFSINVIPEFQDMGIDFNQMYLSLTDWLWVLLLSFQSFLGIELYKWWARKKKIYF